MTAAISLAALVLSGAGVDADNGSRIDDDLRLRELATGVHLVTQVWPLGSHSLVAEMPDGTLLLADTPATHEATERLLTWLREEYGPRPLVLIDGHFHADAAGGNRFAETPIAPPSRTFPLKEGLTLDFAGETVQVVYPGPSHTRDSVAVYFPQRRVLFGGCLVIGMDRVGFTGHADLERFGPDVLDHTLRLLEEYVAAGE